MQGLHMLHQKHKMWGGLCYDKHVELLEFESLSITVRTNKKIRYICMELPGWLKW